LKNYSFGVLTISWDLVDMGLFPSLFVTRDGERVDGYVDGDLGCVVLFVKIKKK